MELGADRKKKMRSNGNIVEDRSVLQPPGKHGKGTISNDKPVELLQTWSQMKVGNTL